MKQAIILLVAIAVFTSCNDTAKVAGTNENENKDYARVHEHMKDVYHAIETGDVSKIDSLVTDDVVDHNGNIDGSDVKGRDSLKKMLSQIHTYFEPGLSMELVSDAISPDGNYHFALVKMKGKAKANPWGMKPGEEIDDTSVDVVKVKDGKASDHWGFMSMGDFNEMMKNMQGGMPPAKDANKK
jgi:ketosteroid isomerase-like protein